MTIIVIKRDFIADKEFEKNCFVLVKLDEIDYIWFTYNQRPSRDAAPEPLVILQYEYTDPKTNAFQLRTKYVLKGEEIKQFLRKFQSLIGIRHSIHLTHSPPSSL